MIFLLAVRSVSLHDVADETGSGYGIELAQLQKSSDLLTNAFRLAHKCVCVGVVVVVVGGGGGGGVDVDGRGGGLFP